MRFISFTSPIGEITISINDGKLTNLTILKNNPSQSHNKSLSTLDAKIKKTILQWLENPSTKFNFPFHATGTEFQEKVWNLLLKIPFGQTLTYGSLAKELNTSPRAIGNACRNNPIQIIIPCHRVVSAKGIGGYNGSTFGEPLKIKKWLLAHEIQDNNQHKM